MAGYRKLGRPSDQRRAILRNLTTALLWNGKIVTTEARAKEVRSIAEKLLTAAINTYSDTVEVTREKKNDKGDKVELSVTNDGPAKLAARRHIMSYLYEVPLPRKHKESKGDYTERARKIHHPVVEKIFRELAPKYDKRRQDKGTGGGYTRILKKGPRRGDGAEMVILELID
ncbi:MAG: 50S ribosomal protein L17 [Christensenellales bacterium]|jgi:large subunit ribosomal protein L17